MSYKPKIKKLLEPIRMGNVILKNRMVNAAYVGFEIDNKGGRVAGVSDAMKSHLEAIAKGGVGLCITESCAVDYPLGLTGRYKLHITQESFISELSELPRHTHAYNCPLFLQLHHGGPSFSHKARYGAVSEEWSKKENSDIEIDPNLQAVAASSLTDDEKPIYLQSRPRGLAIPEIKEIIGKFAKGAEWAQKAGFDGVELHFAHGYLVNTFLSRVWNKRQDEYGSQNLENRARFGVEILRAIRECCGESFPVGVRINGKEWGAKNATTSEESQGLAKIFEKAGAAYISVTGYGYGFGSDMFWMFPDQALYPEPPEHLIELVKTIKKPGAMVPYAEAIKKAVSIPVIVVGKLSPELGEWILKNGKADMIAFARRLIADPELPNKVASGRLEDIAPCTGCMACFLAIRVGHPLRCRINASVGREWEYAIKPAEKKKKVLVVGAGPAGMELARVAALRGHIVTLCEKGYKLGGLLPLAEMIKGVETEDLSAFVGYFKNQMKKLGVEMILGREVDWELVKKIQPDVVAITAGGEITTPSIMGIESSKVIRTQDLHHRAKFLLRFFKPGFLNWLTKIWMPIGKKVVVIGGLIQGCEVAEFLVKRGRKVTIAEESEELGSGIPEAKRGRLISWLSQNGVEMLTEIQYEKITDKGLSIIKKGGEKVTIEADSILIALPAKPNTELFKNLEGKVPELYMVGDCKVPGLIVDAVADGSHIGRLI